MGLALMQCCVVFLYVKGEIKHQKPFLLSFVEACCIFDTVNFMEMLNTTEQDWALCCWFFWMELLLSENCKLLQLDISLRKKKNISAQELEHCWPNIRTDTQSYIHYASDIEQP